MSRSIGEMLKNVNKGKLIINATVTAPYNGGGSAYPMTASESKPGRYERDEIKRLMSEVKGIEKALDEWIPEDVAARARRSLELELDVKRARLLQSKAELKRTLAEHEDDDDDDESEEG